MSSSIHSDVHTPSYASDMRILMENMQALNVHHRKDDLLLTSSSSLKDSGFQGKDKSRQKIEMRRDRHECKQQQQRYLSTCV
jgi:hypothetical protein